MNELATLVEEVAFETMGQRLAQQLLDLAQSTHLVKTTHYDLTVEFGTTREVVSRLLKKFERQGWVKLYELRSRLLKETSYVHW